jgi:hypothetical protein
VRLPRHRLCILALKFETLFMITSPDRISDAVQEWKLLKRKGGVKSRRISDAAVNTHAEWECSTRAESGEYESCE